MSQVRYLRELVKRKPRNVFERLYWRLRPSKIKTDVVYMPIYPNHPEYPNAWYSAEGVVCERPFCIYRIDK